VDYILLSYVLEHISRFDAVWSEVYRVLKVGGKVEIRVVHGMSYDPFHTRYFKRVSIKHLTNGYLGRFRLVGKARMEPLRTGFPYWHIKHHFGLDLPILSIAKGMAFTLEKVAD
jgi:ubiquinone/menaquinone biosynthesis C-methylase UbiE